MSKVSKYRIHTTPCWKQKIQEEVKNEGEKKRKKKNELDLKIRTVNRSREGCQDN